MLLFMSLEKDRAFGVNGDNPWIYSCFIVVEEKMALFVYGLTPIW